MGQHWLTDKDTLRAMCHTAQLEPSDVVLEIGPGYGSLTELLVRQARRVVAVEFDEKLARELPKRVLATNLEVVSQDILGFDYADLPPDYKIVANIPYYLTSNLLRVISETSNPPIVAVLLVQKEVAERLAAPPGAMSLLSVTAQFYWQVSVGREVKAELFTPRPKVDSRIVILTRHPALIYDVPAKDFFRLVKAGFAQRRKTLLNSLSASLNMPRDSTLKLCQTAGIQAGRRAQTLSLEEWKALYDAMNT